jgi:hypothetical protein
MVLFSQLKMTATQFWEDIEYDSEDERYEQGLCEQEDKVNGLGTRISDEIMALAAQDDDDKLAQQMRLYKQM